MKRVLLYLATLMLLAACQNFPYAGAAMQTDQQRSPWSVATINRIPVSAP